PRRSPSATARATAGEREQRRLMPGEGRLVVERRAHEALEDRMAVERPRLELRVELARDEPRMVAQLDHLDELAVLRQPREHEAVLLEGLAILVVHLVA